MRNNNYARFERETPFERPYRDHSETASIAIREGDALRRKLEGRRILEAQPVMFSEAA